MLKGWCVCHVVLETTNRVVWGRFVNFKLQYFLTQNQLWELQGKSHGKSGAQILLLLDILDLCSQQLQLLFPLIQRNVLTFYCS